jgi:hypothetical protein
MCDQADLSRWTVEIAAEGMDAHTTMADLSITMDEATLTMHSSFAPALAGFVNKTGGTTAPHPRPPLRAV